MKMTNIVKNKRGGKELGKGVNGIAYTYDDDTCTKLEIYDNNNNVINNNVINNNVINNKNETLVYKLLNIKNSTNDKDNNREIKNNKVIYNLFQKNLIITTLDDNIAYLKCDYKNNDNKNKYNIYATVNKYFKNGDATTIDVWNYELIKQLIKDIIKFISILHTNGYAHTDIKLDNIFINDNKQSFTVGDYGELHKLNDVNFLNSSTMKYWGTLYIYNEKTTTIDEKYIDDLDDLDKNNKLDDRLKYNLVYKIYNIMIDLSGISYIVIQQILQPIKHNLTELEIKHIKDCINTLIKMPEKISLLLLNDNYDINFTKLNIIFNQNIEDCLNCLKKLNTGGSKRIKKNIKS